MSGPDVGAEPRFVIGTGRCGSTLLSRMLGSHHETAAVHEFFNGLDWGRRFAAGNVTAGELVDLLTAEQGVTTRLIAMGYRAPEITYPFERAGVRWSAGEAVPWLLVSMMTPLTDDPRSRFPSDPDALYDAFVDHIAALPAQPMAAHYGAVMAWLAWATGKTVWVERSGSSIQYVEDLHTLYPGARFCHIHRDGVEAALSLREHRFFRLAIALLYDLLPEVDLASGDDEAWIRSAVESAPPVEAAGAYWCDQVLDGYRALPGIDADQWLDVRFEDLVSDPAPVIERIAAFFDLPDDPGFLERATALVDGVPPSRAAGLDGDERARLEAAVRPGQVLLGRT